VSSGAVQRAVDGAFREEWSRVVATLIRRTGDWDLAEECTQEAFAEALRRWPTDGVPQSVGAWLTTVAGNRAIDRLRRGARGTDLLEQAGREAPPQFETDEDAMPELFAETDEIEDDRLRLIFTCCHPALPLEGRVALTLRALTGRTTAEIAKAFLVPEATMAKRLTRAKAKIAAAGIPYRVPPAHLLSERTAGVLAVLYLLFNEGYSASSGTSLIRPELCDEAIRLTRALQQLMPDEPEVTGTLALMLLQHSRRHARVGNDGELLTLEAQDRSLWEKAELDEGLRLLEAALRRRQIGTYQLQAAIAACHARAPTPEDTDWTRITALYQQLALIVPSPIVELNRAVAVGMAFGPQAGLDLVDALKEEPALKDYHLLPSVRGDLLKKLGRTDEARIEFERAASLTRNAKERELLMKRATT
jgi:RNA polymerase sigma-70 factor (ECF subfamily)